MDHKRQHWIPQGYLKAWCDPATPEGHDPYVWQFTRDGASSRKKAPKKIFHEPDLYTIRLPNGVRDLRVEHGLAGLENDFVTIREQKLERALPLTAEEDVLVRMFVAAMHSRTPFQLAHWRSNWEQVAVMGRAFQQSMDAGEPVPTSLPPRGRTYSLEEVEKLAAADRGQLLVPMIQAVTPALCDMNLTVFESDDSIGFIASDDPCVFFDQAVHGPAASRRSVGTASPSIEITFPVSPSTLLMLTWQLPQKRLPAPDALLHEVNRRTRLNARESFIVQTHETRKEWFEPPADTG